MKPKQNIPDIFTLANFSLTKGEIELFTDENTPEYQIIRYDTGNQVNSLNPNKNYADFVVALKKNKPVISQIRIDLYDGYSQFTLITLSREINGVLYKKTLPAVAFIHTNQFMSNALNIGSSVDPEKELQLPLDGKTKITIESGFGHVRLSLYESTSENIKNPDYDKMFLGTISNQSNGMFYDYVEFNNPTIDSQTFRILFTPEGIKTDNPNVEVKSENRNYEPTDKVIIWKSAVTEDNKQQLYHPILLGSFNKIEDADQNIDDVLHPTTMLNQFLQNIIVNGQQTEMPVHRSAQGVYTYRLLAKSRIHFFILKNCIKLPPTGIETKVMLISADSKTQTIHITAEPSDKKEEPQFKPQTP